MRAFVLVHVWHLLVSRVKTRSFNLRSKYISVLDKLSPFGVGVIYCKNISLMGGGVVHENESPCSEGEAIDGLAFLPGSDMNWIDPPMGGE